MNHNQPHSREQGFSLIELLIVIIIMAVVLGTVFSLLNSSLRTQTTSDQLTEAQQGMRIAQEYITRDLYNTADGLRGINPDVRRGFITTYLSQNISVPGDVNRAVVPLGMIVADDEAANNIAVPGAVAGTTVLKDTDRITLLSTPDPGSASVSINSVDVNGFHRGNGNGEMYVNTANGNLVRSGEIYMLYNAAASAVGSTFVTVTGVSDRTGGKIISFGTTNDYGLNSGAVERVTANDASVPLTLERVYMIHYFVDSNKRLLRRVFGQASILNGVAQPFTDNIIAEHVTQLEFRHILRQINSNNVPQPPEIVNKFLTDDQVNSERQVEVTIGVESTRQTTSTSPLIEDRRVDVAATTITSPRNLQFYTSLEP